MGYRSDVYLYCHKNVYDRMRQDALKSNNKYIKDIVFNPDEYNVLSSSELLIKWFYCKWYSSYEDVKFVRDTLLDVILQCEETDDSTKIDNCYFKLIEVGEDNQTFETCNDDDYESHTSDFYPYTEINIPFNIINTCQVPRFQSLIKTRLKPSLIKIK